MKLLSISLLAAMAALGLAACDNPGPTTASPGSAAAPANVQSGVGTSQEDRFVTQRQGSSRPTQGGRITGIQQEGGGNVTIRSAGDARLEGTNIAGKGGVDVNVGGNLEIAAARDKRTSSTFFCAPASSTPATAATSRVSRSSAAS